MRGAHGGYRLAKPPAQISLDQILAAVVEAASMPPLVAGQQAEDWVTSVLWQRLNQKLKEAFCGITLEDLYYDARSWQAAQGEGGSFVV